MVNFGPLTAEISWRVQGAPANFNGFHVFASLLQWCRSGGQPNLARCLAVSWASTVYTYISISRGSCPLTNFARCKIHFVSKSCVLLYWQCHCTALEQWASAKICGILQGMELQNFCRGHHLYSAEQIPCWALAHILVFPKKFHDTHIIGLSEIFNCLLCIPCTYKLWHFEHSCYGHPME